MGDGPRSARISRDEDGHAVGCAIFLAPDDLREAGVDLVVARSVAYVVSEGVLRLSATNLDKGDEPVVHQTTKGWPP